MFHRPLLPHTVASRQPASITGSVAPGVACTKSQSDPLKMATDRGGSGGSDGMTFAPVGLK
jgi:hypothetical protein